MAVIMNKLTGEDKRSQERIRHINKVNRKAKQLFEAAFSSPRSIITQEHFLERWQQFEQTLLHTFGEQKDLRRGFKQGEHTLRTYRQAYGWSFSPPSMLITNAPVKQLRDKVWLQNAWKTYDSYSIWRTNYLTNDTTCPELRFQALILSLIFESGQGSVDIIQAFINALLKEKQLPLQHFGTYTYTVLTLNSNRLNTNVWLDGERATQYNCYLSIQTLAQLNLWRKTPKCHWLRPKPIDYFQKITHNFNAKSIPQTLKKFASSAMKWFEIHCNSNLSEALLEYRIDRTQSYSLSAQNLQQIFEPFCKPIANCSFYHFNTGISVPHATREEHVSSSQIMVADKEYYDLIKQLFKQQPNGTKLSKTKTIESLKNILKIYHLKPWQKCLIKWLVMKSNTCNLASLNKYINSLLKDWIFINQEHDLSNVMSNDELEEIYQLQIDRHNTERSKVYFTARLRDLHGFAYHFLGLPTLSDSFFDINTDKKHTNAGVVSEPIFKALLSNIEQLADINESEKLAIQTLCILSYRCGLRIGEACKIQMGNISQCSTVWIQIRTNKFGNNKTASSLRMIPLLPLLRENEKTIVQNYLSHKRTLSKSSTSPFLTMSSDLNKPLDKTAVSIYVGQFLKAASGLNHLVFYHLRHSCLSRLQLMLELDNPQKVFPHFYPYDAQQNNRIKKLLFKNSTTKGYWEIAALAGHEDPDMTFRHYFHFSDMLAAPPLSEYHQELSVKEAMLAGLSSRRNHQSIASDSGSFLTFHAYDKLKHKLNICNIKSKFTDELSYPETSIEQQTTEKKLLSIEMCYQILEAITEGISIDTLAHKYHVTQEHIDKWLANAQYLARLSVYSSNPAYRRNRRHISKIRTGKLFPGRLKTASEREYINKFSAVLRTHYKDNQNMINKQIIYCLKHTSINRSGVTFYRPDDLQDFINTFTFAIPKSHWRAVKLYMKSSTIKEKWNDVLKGIKVLTEVKGSSNGRSGHGSVRLELISPDEQNIIEGNHMRKYSSHLLVFMMYFTFVMIGNEHSRIPNTKQQRIGKKYN